MLIDDGINRVRFDSPAELAEFMRDQSSCYMVDGRPNFYGETTGAMAVRYATSGNDACVPAAQKMLSGFEAELPIACMSDEATVSGCYPVVAEFLSGEPECMRMPTPVGNNAAPLSVFVDLTCSEGISPAQMTERGIAILAAVMALSARRPISLEVGCIMGCYRKADDSERSRGEEFSIVSTVIDTAPLDLATAAWFMSDVAAARRLMYGASFALHQFNGGWPQFTGVDYAGTETAGYLSRVRELLDLGTETLYMPAVVCDTKGHIAAILKGPSAWCAGIVRKHGNALAELLEA